VDNGSQEDISGELKIRFPAVDLLSLPTNIGFAPAVNIAVQHAFQDPDCQFIFLLNNDARIHPNALKILAQAAEEYPLAGIFSPIIYDQDAPKRIWYAGARRRPGILAAADTGRGKIDHGQFTISPVDYVFGTAMFIRRSVFDHIGCFDERFFLYLEDLDFCLRAQDNGFELLFVPQAQVWHAGSASTAHNLALRRYHHLRSSILFLKKHASRLSLVPAVPFWSLVLARMLLQDLLRGDPKMITPYTSALRFGVQENLTYFSESSD
jgi:GT2 family glycosyltransferase